MINGEVISDMCYFSLTVLFVFGGVGTVRIEMIKHV